MEEARLRETEHGAVVEGSGWFVVNLAELAWETIPGHGAWCAFEADDARAPHLGVGVHVLMPGEPSAKYHAESAQEGFLVLEGECVVVVEEQERRLRQWDYLHCPPGVAHITVGAGDGPCAILMLGARFPGRTIHYPVSELAARHGASVQAPTDSPREAYAGEPEPVRVRAPWPR
jgi:uncharacterized cupin superfamily protein